MDKEYSLFMLINAGAGYLGMVGIIIGGMLTPTHAGWALLEVLLGGMVVALYAGGFEIISDGLPLRGVRCKRFSYNTQRVGRNDNPSITIQ